jgi:hypothetical protein
MSDKVEAKTAKKPNIFKSFLIALIALAVILGMVLGVFPLLGLPGWPFTFFLFYFLSIAGLAKEKLLPTAVGGFIGMTVSFSPGLIGALTGDEGIGWVVFLVALLVLVALVVDKRVKVVDHLCMLMITALLPPGLHLDLSPETYLPSVITYAIAVALFTIAVFFLSSRAKKKAAAMDDEAASQE